MKRILLLILLWGTCLCAETFTYTFSTPVEGMRNITQSIGYRPHTEGMDAATVLHEQEKLKPLPHGFVENGPSNGIWTSVTLRNDTASFMELALYNPYVIIPVLHAYLYQEGVLLQEFKRGSWQDPALYSPFVRSNAVTVTLQPKSSVTLVTYLNAAIMLQGKWYVENRSDYEHQLLVEIILGVLLGSLTLLTVLISMAVYKYLKDRAFLYYAIYMTMYFILLYFETGAWIWTNPGLPPRVLMDGVGIITGLITIPGILFMQTFFKTRTHFPRFHKLLKIILIAFLLILPLTATPLIDPRFYAVIPWLLLLTFMKLILMLSLSAVATWRRFPGATYLLMGHGSILTVSLIKIVQLAIGNDDVYVMLIFMAIGFGMNLLFHTLALGVRVRQIQFELDTSKKALEMRARDTAIASTIANISHQWKAPLAQMGALLTKLEFLIERKNDGMQADTSKTLELVHVIDTQLQYMRAVGDEYQRLYHSESVPVMIDVTKAMEKIGILLKQRLQDAGVTVTIENETGKTGLMTFPNTLTQVLMIIVENALEIFQLRNRLVPGIVMRAKKTDGHVRIEIEDNGGGIETKPVEKIFFLGVSQKESGGIGLYLAAELVNNRLHGDIHAENRSDGACFVVTLPDG